VREFVSVFGASGNTAPNIKYLDSPKSIVDLDEALILIDFRFQNMIADYQTAKTIGHRS